MTSSTPSSSSTTWSPNKAAPDELKDAFQQAHSAVQWLARMVNSYTVPASDGSHLHMHWNSDGPVITTTEIAEGTVVEMRLPQMVLQFVEQGERTKHEVELDDKSPARIEAWTLIELLHRGIDRDSYSKTLPYDVSYLLGGDAQDYQTLGKEQAFEDMTGWLILAGELLNAAAEDAAKAGQGASSGLMFAPESFSLFVRIHPESGRPAVGNYIELGFCAGTSSELGPHYYSSLARDTEPKRLSIAQIGAQSMSRADVTAFFAVPAQIDQLNAG